MSQNPMQALQNIIQSKGPGVVSQRTVKWSHTRDSRSNAKTVLKCPFSNINTDDPKVPCQPPGAGMRHSSCTFALDKQTKPPVWAQLGGVAMPRFPQPFLLLLLLPFLCHFVVRAAYFSQFSSMRQPERDPCYDSSGRPIRCVPDFINAAYGKPVIASSTCGSGGKPSSFCVVSESTGGLLQEKCELCDPSDLRLAHPAALLTDLNNANNLTCWVSEPTSAYPNNVTLTLSLGKKFEITYVSLHFCGRLADSLAIYKSANRGRSWTPMQFYSTECQKVYQRTKEAPINRENEQAARCTDSHILSPLSDRIAFATLEGRPSAMEFEQSPVLQDWVTATDIRVVFNRLSADQAELYGLAESDKLSERIRRDNASVVELSEPDRARERCVIDRMGRYACDCKHATTGLDCEKCRPFHYDRPWARATAEDANACVACNCNLHSRKCRFNAELYRLSGYQSGGVCLNCRHNTAGRNCHYCRFGYFRDQSKPITHRKACKPCLCHPIGSLSRNCNQTSGQCICKPGVDGPTCNRCAKGFKQSLSPDTPCIRPPPLSSLAKSTYPKEDCEKCRATPNRLTHKKFCRRDYALKLQLIGRELVDGWAKFRAQLIDRPIKDQRGTLESREMGDGAELSLWLPNRNLLCKCPRLKVGRKYLLLARHGSFKSDAKSIAKDLGVEFGGKGDKPSLKQSPSAVVFDRQTVVMEWGDEVAERVQRFGHRRHFVEKCRRIRAEEDAAQGKIRRRRGGASACLCPGGGAIVLGLPFGRGEKALPAGKGMKIPFVASRDVNSCWWCTSTQRTKRSLGNISRPPPARLPPHRLPTVLLQHLLPLISLIRRHLPLCATIPTHLLTILNHRQPPRRSHQSLFLLFVISFPLRTLAHYQGASSDYLFGSNSPRYCFSCMSKEFESHWSYLDEIYYRPMNFTDECHAIPTGALIGRTPCAHSVCVTVIEPRMLAGQYLGNNVIRGCFSSVFKYGEAPTDNLVDTSCSTFPMRALLPRHLALKASNRTVELCRCLGNLCNDYPWTPLINSSDAHQRNAPTTAIAICTMIILMSILFHSFSFSPSVPQFHSLTFKINC
uniref:Netrin n=1 Tax=Globodera rostochiensis TaxID=31243 RepID=A0A914H193_GLORO